MKSHLPLCKAIYLTIFFKFQSFGRKQFHHCAIPQMLQTLILYKCVKRGSGGAEQTGAIKAEVEVKTFDIAGPVREICSLQECFDLIR